MSNTAGHLIGIYLPASARVIKRDKKYTVSMESCKIRQVLQCCTVRLKLIHLCSVTNTNHSFL